MQQHHTIQRQQKAFWLGEERAACLCEAFLVVLPLEDVQRHFGLEPPLPVSILYSHTRAHTPHTKTIVLHKAARVGVDVSLPTQGCTILTMWALCVRLDYTYMGS